MRGTVPLLVALMSLPVSAAAGEDDPALPWDVRMPFRLGGGGTTMWGGSPGFSASLSGIFLGKEIQHTNLHPLLCLGMDSVRAKDAPIMLIDKDTMKPKEGFEQGLLHIETGFGLHLGGSSGFSGEFTFAPGATFIDIPGKFKQNPISTVGLGLSWRLEIIPWFISLHRGDDDEEFRDPGFGDWFLSSLSIYALVRADWVEANEGVFVGGGVGFDLARIIIAPFTRKIF